MFDDPRWQIPLLFVLVGLGWTLSVGLTALFGGWRRMADQFRTDQRPPERMLRPYAVRIGWCSYGACLKFGVGQRGLYLAPSVLFRPFHPPLLIPWRAIRAEPSRHFFIRVWRLTIGEANVRITIRDRLYRELKDHIGRTE